MPEVRKEAAPEESVWRRQYELLLDGLPDAVFVCGPKGNILAANAAAEKLTGVARGDLLGTKLRHLLTPEAHENLREHTESALSTGQAFRTQIELKSEGGNYAMLEIRGSVQREGFWPVAVVYVARESADVKRVEEARMQETRFRLMAKNLTEMVLAFDMDRRLTFANPAAETLTGYSSAELEQAQFICWIHPEDRERMLGHWDGLFQGTSFYEEVYRLVTKDGRMKWVAASWGPILDDSGRQVGVQGRERDITSKVMAEETLRQSEQVLRVNEERYRTLFEESPFPLWEEDFSRVKQYLDELAARGVTNLRGYLAEHRDALIECVRRVRILDVNLAARNFYGVERREELMGDLSRIFDEGAYENFAEELATLWETNSTFQSEFQARTPRGESRTVNMIVSIAEGPANDWSRVVVSFFDITDRKRLEDQLLQSQKLESLGRLAGGIAHDFNNLLTVINGYSDLLLHSMAADHPLRGGLLEVHNAGLRGAELTQQLLAFSRKQIAQLRPLDLNALIRDSEGMLKRVIGEDIRLAIHLDPAAGIVKADSGQMHQVLMNLVVNGRDAMPNGGTLTIETRHVDLLDQAKEPGAPPARRPYVMLRIRDTGIGMDEETKQHLFEPFFTTKHASKGTGLGLATVFGVVTQNGGHISVSSEPGHGASFSVFLPRTSTAPKAEAPPRPPAAVTAGKGAILVVEDQPEVRELTCTVLRQSGYEVLEATDGLEALLLLQEYGRPIRLLLTDVIMPGMNGKELAARLVSIRPDVKVVYMSGYTDRIMSESGVLDSSVAFLQKPFTPGRLLAMVQKALE